MGRGRRASEASWHNVAVLRHVVISMVAEQLGATDCERDWRRLAGPTRRTLYVAYLAAGAWIILASAPGRRTQTQTVFGVAVAGVGVGSILFHGPMPPGARLVHDVSIAAVFLLVAVSGVGTLLRWDERRVLGVFLLATSPRSGS